MRTPEELGLIRRLTILDATSCCADAANSSDTQSLVLGQFVIAELLKACKGGIKKVTCSAQRRFLPYNDGDVILLSRPKTRIRLGFLSDADRAPGAAYANPAS